MSRRFVLGIKDLENDSYVWKVRGDKLGIANYLKNNLDKLLDVDLSDYEEIVIRDDSDIEEE